MTCEDIFYCAEQVRRHDPDRYLLTLLAPREARPALFSVYAFNIEIAKIRESVSETLLGEIRLQWWRDTLDALFEGERREHAVARPLGDAVRRHGLPRLHFDRLIAGRALDLDGRVPDTLKDLLCYAEATSAPLVHIALAIMGVQGEAPVNAGTHAGIAWALCGLIRAIPAHHAAGRQYLPQALCEKYGIAPSDTAATAGCEALAAIVCEIAETAEHEIGMAREAASLVPRTAVPALLPATFAASCVRRFRRAGFNPYDRRVAEVPPMIAWRLALQRAIGRY